MPPTAADPASYKLSTYTYIYQAQYGSPEVDGTTPTITKIEVAADGKSVRLFIDQIQEGHVHELHLDGVRSAAGEPLLASGGLLHAELHSTNSRPLSRASDSVSDRARCRRQYRSSAGLLTPGQSTIELPPRWRHPVI